QVVDDDCDALAASRGHQLGSLLNRFRPARVVRRRQGLLPLLRGWLGAGSQRRARAAPGAVHRRAGFAKRQRDAASYSSSSSGHEHHAIAQLWGLISGSLGHGSTSQETGRIIESPFINVKWKINSHSVILLSGLACRVAEKKRAERTPPSYYEGGLLFRFL